jgi:glyoxylase-like metal-dependent hydrolase (beta-lactamase superfamily II)
MMAIYGNRAGPTTIEEHRRGSLMPCLSVPVELSQNLYVLYSEHPHVDSGNVYLIAGERPILIDCGSERATTQIARNIAQLDIGIDEIDQVIVTHADYDHVQGFHRLHEMNPNLRLKIHRPDLSVVEEADDYRTAAYVYGRTFVRLDAASCEPVDDGDIIAAGDTELTVISTPGHTEGSVCLLGEIDGRSVLIAGDTVGGAMRSLDGASLEVWAESAGAWARSLQHLSTLAFDWVLNGHEPAAGLPIQRAQFDRMVARFGTMLNPWFSLGEADPAPADNRSLALTRHT